MPQLLNRRLKHLLSIESLLGQRVMLAALSLAWAAYLFGPQVHINLINMGGGALLISHALIILVNIMFGDEEFIPISEGLIGVVMWTLVIVEHIMGNAQYLDDTLYLQSVPLIFSWWLLANGLARLKIN